MVSDTRSTTRLTVAQALVTWMCAQRIETGAGIKPLFAHVFGIFGHGNVTCLAEALERVQDQLPTWRGQNEQSMTLAAIAYAKAKRRRAFLPAHCFGMIRNLTHVVIGQSLRSDVKVL